jgi:hypothetical protein
MMDERFNAVLRVQKINPGSRILIFFHLGSRIWDQATATKEERGKICRPTFFVATK